MRIALSAAVLSSVFLPAAFVAAEDGPPRAADVAGGEMQSSDKDGTTSTAPTAVNTARRSRGWNDKRRTFGGYLSNLAYGGSRLLSIDNAPILLGGGTAAATATAFDTSTVSYFDRHPARTFGNIGEVAGGPVVATGLVIGLYGLGRLTPNDRFRSFSYDAGQAMLIAAAYGTVLKLSSHRLRPDQSNLQSFPSGHTAVAFSWAAAAGKYYGPAGAIAAYGAASLIAVSRLAHRSHYLSDVAAGAALGYVSGLTVVRANNREMAGKPADRRARLSLTPDFGPRGDGSGVAVSLQF
jgi:membrane-associated phospholipid phosphatase